MKYMLTNKYIEDEGVRLYQIQALKDFGDVKAGQLGGWIESVANLDQHGDAWVYGNAWVFGDANVGGNAEVYGDARVGGNARVYGDAEVYFVSY